VWALAAAWKVSRRENKSGNVRDIQAGSCNHCRSGKTKLRIIFRKCVFVALDTQRDMRIRPIILSSLSCPALQKFSTLSHKRNDFQENVIELHIYICVHVKYPLFLSDFSETLIFSTDFRKTLITNFMKIRPVRTEIFHADGRTNRQTARYEEANSRFSQFYERAYKRLHQLGIQLRFPVLEPWL